MTEWTILASLSDSCPHRIEIGIGDITVQKVDAIVNAANEFLQHGGGVAGAIVRKGGSIIQEESNLIGYCPTGNAVATSAGQLPAKWVIHAVGPRGSDDHASEKLRWAYWSALREGERLECESIAIPAISTGIFGFPKQKGCQIGLKAVLDFLHSESRKLHYVRLIDLSWDGALYFVRALMDLDIGQPWVVERFDA